MQVAGGRVRPHKAVATASLGFSKRRSGASLTLAALRRVRCADVFDPGRSPGRPHSGPYEGRLRATSAKKADASAPSPEAASASWPNRARSDRSTSRRARSARSWSAHGLLDVPRRLLGRELAPRPPDGAGEVVLQGRGDEPRGLLGGRPREPMRDASRQPSRRGPAPDDKESHPGRGDEGRGDAPNPGAGLRGRFRGQLRERRRIKPRHVNHPDRDARRPRLDVTVHLRVERGDGDARQCHNARLGRAGPVAERPRRRVGDAVGAGRLDLQPAEAIELGQDRPLRRGPRAGAGEHEPVLERLPDADRGRDRLGPRLQGPDASQVARRTPLGRDRADGQPDRRRRPATLAEAGDEGRDRERSRAGGRDAISGDEDIRLGRDIADPARPHGPEQGVDGLDLGSIDRRGRDLGPLSLRDDPDADLDGLADVIRLLRDAGFHSETGILGLKGAERHQEQGDRVSERRRRTPFGGGTGSLANPGLPGPPDRGSQANPCHPEGRRRAFRHSNEVGQLPILPIGRMRPLRRLGQAVLEGLADLLDRVIEPLLGRRPLGLPRSGSEPPAPPAPRGPSPPSPGPRGAAALGSGRGACGGSSSGAGSRWLAFSLSRFSAYSRLIAASRRTASRSRERRVEARQSS